MAARRNGRRASRASIAGRVVLGAFTALAGIILVGVVGAIALCFAWLQDLPDYNDLDAYNIAQPTRVYASDGTTLLAEFELESRKAVPLDQISKYVIQGTTATEDARFYEHNGVDLKGIARAVVHNLSGGELEGASTITQQFVRNTILVDEMDDISLKRKVREAYLAIMLEQRYSKDEILLMYLNDVNYGCGAHGIEAAAERYFSKHAAELTLSEAATLAGIPQSPTYNNPIDYPENCLLHRNHVLERMLSLGMITQEEYDVAVAESIELSPAALSELGIVAYPYFTSYVRNQLAALGEGYGLSAEEVSAGGLTVITTLDVGVQQAADRASVVKCAGSDVFECAIVAIDPENGHVKALVGGTDYSESQVNMATGEGGSGRQAGSTFKTFALAAAIEQGIDPDTLIDAGYQAVLPGWDGFPVANIDYIDYGVRSIARAFWVSSNTAFARLSGSIGEESVIEMAHRLGVKSDLPAVPSITLGVGSVTPLEMASAYATLAGGGVYYEPECILQIYDSSGGLIVDNTSPQGKRVLSESVAGATVEIMKGTITEGSGGAAKLANGQVAAGKTGTSDGYKDVWYCGITPQYSVAIWYGDRSDYVDAQSASGSCAGVFSDFLDRALEDEPVEDFFAYEEPEYVEGYVDATYHIGSW